MAGSWLLLLAFRVSSCIVATSGWASSEAFLVQGSGVLGSAMAASPPGLGRFRAATCGRWGDVGALVSVARKEARRHYFMRVARRAMRTRKPALASRSRSASAAQVAVPAAMAAPRWAPPALTRASLPSQARPRMTKKKRKRKMPACVLPRSSSEHMLAVCPSMIARAEAKAAPRFFADFTDGGTVSVSEFVTRLDWSSPDRARQAAVWARTLDIADADRLRDRSPRAWSNMVCILVAVYLSEFQPAFARASREAAAHGLCFPAVPLRGRFGWRARARWAGLLGIPLYDDAEDFEDVD